MAMVDQQKATAAIESVRTFAAQVASELQPLAPPDALREPLEKAMQGQPVTFSMVLEAVGNKSYVADLSAFLASPMGQLVEPGTAGNLIAEAAALEPHLFHLRNLAQLHRDAVAQVGQGLDPGQEGDGQ